MKIILFLFFAFSSVVPSLAGIYYVSPRGDDAQSGTSAAAAWRTIDRVNSTTFVPGDQILFEGGKTFAGGIWLRAQSQGTATRPIVVSSYGVGRATIASGTSFGFYAHNSAGIVLRRLVFVGAGRLDNTNSGVIFYIDSVNTHLQYLRLDSLDVSGYQKTGILVGSWNGTSGYTDVRITRCQVHANGEAGLASYAQDLAAHHSWYVGNCQAFDNAGRADVTTTHTGNGIVLSGIDGALIEHCEAYHNGWLNANPRGGPVGIWGWCCNNLVIQSCESHHNQSGTTHDGGGFDLDGGCTNSVLQYNYSHDNDGPGYLLAQYPYAPPMHDLTVRYNVSENDARAHNQGALQVWSSGANGGIQRVVFHNNTVLLSPPTDGTRPKAVFISSAGFGNLSFRNNVLQTTDGLAVLSTYATVGLRLEGNCYWSSEAPLLLEWNGTVYNQLPAWRAATGQEQLSDGRATGLNASPQLHTTASSFAPLPASPLFGAGLAMQTEFSINPGPRDFIGNPTALAPEKGNIGALEAQAKPLPVVLFSFAVTRRAGTARLHWATTTEKGNAFFEVESSVDGQTFSRLHRVLGHGTTTQHQDYYYTDQNVARYGTNKVYYRLRQVDADGTATYSPVRVLSGASAADGSGFLQAWPNPAAGSTVVIMQGGKDSYVRLLNVRGQEVVNVMVAADGTATLPVVGLTAGLYLVQCGSQSVRLVLMD